MVQGGLSIYKLYSPYGNAIWRALVAEQDFGCAIDVMLRGIQDLHPQYFLLKIESIVLV